MGVLPITAAATYLGHALDDLSASDPLLWVAVGVIVILALLTVHSRPAAQALSALISPARSTPAHASARGTVPTARLQGGERDVLGADVLVAAGERDLQRALEHELGRVAELRRLRRTG